MHSLIQLFNRFQKQTDFNLNQGEL